MKIRSTLSLVVLALAVSSTMAAPAFARSHHHHGKRAAMAPHASPAPKVVEKTASAQAAAVTAPAPHN